MSDSSRSGGDQGLSSSAHPSRARCVAFKGFGDLDVLEVIELPVRDPGPGEVRLRVHAAALSKTDVRGRQGEYVDWFYADLEPPYISGFDAAGVLDAVGPDVDRVSVGDEVMAVVKPFRPEGGTHAEFIIVPAASVVALPDGTTFEEAATIPMNAITAHQALDVLQLAPGSTLAVTGGAGWVATMAIRLAKARGLRVVADAKQQDVEWVKSNGADEVVARGADVADRFLQVAPGGVDGLIDTALMGPDVFRAVRDQGGIAFLYGKTGEPGRGITCHEVWALERFEDTAVLESIGALVSEGKVKGLVAASFTPDEAAAAHQMVEAGGFRGRPVFVFGT